MMAKGNLVISACERVPWLSRPLLRSFYQLGAMPDRAAWIGLALRERLCAGQGKRTIRIGDHIRMQVDLSSSIGQAIYFDGSYEPGIARYLSGALRPGDIAIDGGANVGELSLRMARRVGASGRVFAVEPSPDTFAALCTNVGMNSALNITPVCAAITRGDSTAKFHVGQDAHSLSSSIYPLLETATDEINVNATSIDRLVDEYQLPHVDLLKLDVEGAELEALAGAAGVLKSTHRPKLIVEYNSTVAVRAGWSLDDLTQELLSHDYALHVVGERGSLIPLNSHSMAATEAISKIDIVAIPR